MTWRSIPLLALPLLLWPAAASGQKTVQQVRAASADGAVRINLVAGSVRITGWDRDSIAVNGTVPSPRDFSFTVSGVGAKLGVSDERGEAPVQLEVRVPARSQVWIRTASAAVAVAGVRGDVDVNTVSGSIEVRGQPAELYTESMTGGITLEVDTRSMRARSASGDIVVRGRVADAQVYTVSGVIRILNKVVERGRFESVDGGIHYSGTVARASSVEFITHSGDVDVGLPPDVQADIRISSFQGTVSSELGALQRTSAGRSSEYALTLGSSAAEVVIRTFKGSVRLRKW